MNNKAFGATLKKFAIFFFSEVANLTFYDDQYTNETSIYKNIQVKKNDTFIYHRKQSALNNSIFEEILMTDNRIILL